jgi:hypothetical protein
MNNKKVQITVLANYASKNILYKKLKSKLILALHFTLRHFFFVAFAADLVVFTKVSRQLSKKVIPCPLFPV